MSGSSFGAVTFSGSLIAFGKLSGKIGGKPLLLPRARHVLNLIGLLLVIWFARQFLHAPDIQAGMTPLLIMTVIALLFGAHLVMAIGGADMPVVVSMLNSYSGWAAAATGFMLGNDLLIVVGALVGSSGAILSYIMCRAMNRNFFLRPSPGRVSAAAHRGRQGRERGGACRRGDADQRGGNPPRCCATRRAWSSFPGYGMAVAQAQHVVYEITRLLRDKGVNVRFGIHPGGRFACRVT